MNFRANKGKIKDVRGAAGKMHRATGYGDVLLEVDAGSDGRRVIILKRVLLVPTFAISIVPEHWARSDGVGYHAPALPQPAHINVRDVTVQLNNSNGLNFVDGTPMSEFTGAAFNSGPSGLGGPRVEVEQRGMHSRVASAATFKVFSDEVDKVTDTEVLANILDGKNEHGFQEAAPRFNGPQRTKIRMRMADLGVLTVEDPAHSKFMLFHHKTGHGSMLETAVMAREQGVPMPKIEERWCDHCIKAKLCHAPRSIAPVQHHDLKPFDKVFCDIAGPFPTTSAVNGYKYVIGFIDAKTSTSWVAPMHTQRDVQKWTERFLVWVRNQKVDGDVSLELVRDGMWDPVAGMTIQTDSASVFRSDGFRNLVENRFRCQVQQSPPYEQSKNGKIERLWRTLGESAKAMMLARPRNRWHENMH